MSVKNFVVYKDLEDIYVLCMRQVISSVCEKAWGGTDEGAFGTFKKHDLENTKTINDEIDQRKKQAEEQLKKELEASGEKTKKGKPKKINPDDFKHITAISAKAKSFEKFDFQACNNTLAHLKPVYEKIFKDYKLNDIQKENCISTSKELIRLRNKLAHPDPNDPPSKIVERQKDCINYMNFMFGIGFGSVADKNGVAYYESFQKNYIQYIEQELQRWYYLSDFLDLKKYDASRFLEVCATNNIVADKKDAKYLFCTSNLEKTVEILKNNLAIAGDNVASKPVSAAVVQQASDSTPPKPTEENKKSNKNIYIIVAIVCALLLGGAILAASLIPIFTNGNNNQGNAFPTPSLPQLSSSSDNSVSSTDSISDFESNLSSTTENTAKSEILPKHEQQVDALKYSDRLTLQNSTLYVDVGDFITPPPSQVWSNVTIYSQNPDIAVGQGNLVKGVSRGTTYVIVESSLGTSTAFCVVVE